MNRTRMAVALSLALTPLATPALAHGWGGAGWGADRWSGPTSRQGDGPVEGHVTVSRFVAEGPAAQALGHGTVAAIPAPGEPSAEPRELATYQAAVIDRLARQGYRTDVPEAAAGQLVELRLTHDEVAPQEVHKPVSGEATVGMSNRGSMMGLAVAVDLSKPRGALIATRLEARIRDRATQAVLWEGRADTVTRAGSEKWTDSAIAARLASALFDRFPGATGEDGSNR